MTNGIQYLQHANTFAFCALTLACLLQWRRRRDASIRWATAAFGSLAAISLISLAMKQPSAVPLFLWLVKGILVMLALCPYFLYCFSAAFERPKWPVAWAARISTAVVVVWSLSIPRLPVPGTPETMWWSFYRYAFVAQWTILFAAVAIRLWGGSRREASVARRRMRTIAIAVAAMNGALLLSGFVRNPSDALRLTTQAVFLVSSILFFVGLAPPAWLLRQWRRPEEIAIQSAMGALFRAETREEVAALLLPRAAELVARAAPHLSRNRARYSPRTARSTSSQSRTSGASRWKPAPC